MNLVIDLAFLLFFNYDDLLLYRSKRLTALVNCRPLLLFRAHIARVSWVMWPILITYRWFALFVVILLRVGCLSLFLESFFCPETLELLNDEAGAFRIGPLVLFGKKIDFIDELLYKLVEVLVESPNFALCIFRESLRVDNYFDLFTIVDNDSIQFTFFTIF